jgi:hypothetical protein
MPLILPPKPQPKKLRLHEAVARIIEREPSLDALVVQEILLDLIECEEVPAESEFQPFNIMTPDAEEKHRAGLLGRTFADTLRLWRKRGARFDLKAGLIQVPGYPDSIPLPLISWDVLLGKLRVALKAIGVAAGAPVFTAPTMCITQADASPPQAKSGPVEKASVSESPSLQQKKPNVPREDLESWYKIRVGDWPPTQKHPSADEDWEAAKTRFPDYQVARGRIYGHRRDGVRHKFAPPAWTAPGRRPDSQDPEKLTKKLTKKPTKK